MCARLGWLAWLPMWAGALATLLLPPGGRALSLFAQPPPCRLCCSRSAWVAVRLGQPDNLACCLAGGPLPAPLLLLSLLLQLVEVYSWLEDRNLSDEPCKDGIEVRSARRANGTLLASGRVRGEAVSATWVKGPKLHVQYEWH